MDYDEARSLEKDYESEIEKAGMLFTVPLQLSIIVKRSHSEGIKLKCM